MRNVEGLEKQARENAATEEGLTLYSASTAMGAVLVVFMGAGSLPAAMSPKGVLPASGGKVFVVVEAMVCNGEDPIIMRDPILRRGDAVVARNPDGTWSTVVGPLLGESIDFIGEPEPGQVWMAGQWTREDPSSAFLLKPSGNGWQRVYLPPNAAIVEGVWVRGRTVRVLLREFDLSSDVETLREYRSEDGAKSWQAPKLVKKPPTGPAAGALPLVETRVGSVAAEVNEEDHSFRVVRLGRQPKVLGEFDYARCPQDEL